jgi:NRPS condensation-like uncharacterized protein
MTPDVSSTRTQYSPRVAASANLRLTSMERFWLAEDVPGNSLSFFHKYVLDDDIDEQHVLTALDVVARRHPLPFCQIVKEPNGQTIWQSSQIELRQLVNSQSPEPYERAPKIKLDREPGIRLWYDNNAIWFEYHHMCADGRGALQLERDFFSSYGHPSQVAAGAVDDWVSLQKRSRARITLGGAIVRSTFGWWYLWRGLNANVLPFPDGSPQSDDRIVMNVYDQCLDESMTSAALRFAKTEGVSLNDAILMVVAAAIAERTSDVGGARQVIRLVVPIDMRLAHGNVTTCVNKMSFLYLDMPLRRVETSSSFVRWISKRMRFLKKHMGLVIWRSIQFGPRDVDDLRSYLQQRTNMLSCYVSNLGVIGGLPDFVQAFEATPTLRRDDTPLALMAYTFRGRLHLTAGYDRARVKPEDARRFVQRVATSLRSVEHA